VESDAIREVADRYARTILDAVRREYPNDLRHPMSGPDDRPTPRQVHPAFYGCYDWHSCVEMHWALVRLLRVAGDALPESEVRAVLNGHLTAETIATETAYFTEHPGFKRPYGWGWVLTLAHELSTWDDADAQRWAANLRPLSERIAGLYLSWLPRATYPSRDGAHANTAFGLARALDFAAAQARSGDARLLNAIGAAARTWYAADADYPAGWEPGGADFLSPALTEAELMSAVLGDGFPPWLDRFLPELGAGQPASLFAPAVVSDPTDGQIAHLHGLNLYRAYAFGRIAAALPTGDARAPMLRAAADRHAGAGLSVVTGSDYMVEHWLACYAVLLLTTDR
jgi:Protein of unknown function (DUF2891)